MTVRKLKGSAIQSGTITTTQLSSSVSESISAGGGPKISSLSYPGDDLAANTAGGQTVQINGSGFAANSTVYLNGNAVASGTTTNNLNTGVTFRIGEWRNASEFYTGYIDDFRISRFARYTSNFTPPAAALKDR